MTTAYTSLLGLALPVTGELSGTWGDTVNTAITSLLDTAVAGTTSITTDADITLTTTTGASNQARQAIILWNPASGTVTRNITAPAQSKIYTVINASGGTQSIVIRGAGPTTGVTIAKGESATVAWNGSDFVKVSSSGGAITFTDLTVTGNTILGDAAADTLTVNATSTFASPVNFQGLVKLPSTGRSAAAALTTTAPAFLYGVASTYTDTTSSGTVAFAPFYLLAQPTLSTSNVTTYTNAATLYIANSPITAGSATITNPYSLFIAAGTSWFGGQQVLNGDVTFRNNVGDGLTAKLIKSNAFGAALRFAANGATTTDRNLGIGFVNNADVFTSVLTVGDQVAQVATNFTVSADNLYDIGASGTRFKALYLSGSEYIAGNIYQNAATASAWDANWQALQGSSGAFAQLSTGQDVRIYMNGAVVGAAEKYVATGFASVERMTANGINWSMYASGSAGASFGAPTGRMFFTQSGRLGVGYAVTQTPNSEISTLGGSFSVASTTTSGSTSVGSLSSYSDYSGSNFELTRMQMFTKGAADDGEYKFYTRYGASLVQRLTLGRDGVIGGYFGGGGVTTASYPFQGQEGTASASNDTGWVFTGNMSSGGSYFGNGAGIQLGGITNNPGKIMGGISAHVVSGGSGGAATDERGGLAFWTKSGASAVTQKNMWLYDGSLLGLGGTPYSSNMPTMDIGLYTGLTGDSAGNMQLTANLYNDGAWKAKTGNYGTLYQQNVGDGLHSWFSTTTVIGAGAAATTLTRNMLLTRGGVLQVGYTGGAAPSGNSVIEAVSSSSNAAITAIQSTSQYQLQSNGQDGYLNLSGTGNMYFRFGSGANLRATLAPSGNLSLSGSIYPTATATRTISTNSWSAGNWYEVAPPGTFSNTQVFWVTFRWDHTGGGPYIIAGAFMWVVVNTNGTGTDNAFAPMCSSHTGGASNYFSFRSKAGSSASSGMECSPSAINAGTLVMNFYVFA